MWNWLWNWDKKRKINTLCHRLEAAAAKLVAIRGEIWSSYDSGQQIADFIRNCLDEIRDNTLSVEKKKELWGIFAPTSDWDDVVGDVAFGEEVFSLLDNLYWADIHPNP